MTRILVDPDQLRSLSVRLQQTASDLQGVEGRVGSALGGLAWEARQKANVDGQANHARSQARALAAQADEMSRRLVAKAQAFEEADGQGVELLQVVGWSPPEIRPSSIVAIPIAIGVVSMAGVMAIPIIGITSNIIRSWSTAPSDKEQIRRAADALQGVEGLKPGEWKDLIAEQRKEVLQEAEKALAKAQGRPSLPLEVKRLEKGKNGEFSADENKIFISERLLKGDDLHQALDTMAHEGRHGYQWYAVNHSGFHSNEKEVEAWRDNFINYSDGTKVGFKHYRNQAIEDDAFHYGDQFADTVAPQSVLEEAGEEFLDWAGRVLPDEKKPESKT
jgi:hypothetical protein